MTKVFDLKTCTILLDIPFGTYNDNLVHIDKKGVVRLANNSWLATINTDLDFNANYKSAEKLLRD